MGPPTSQVQCPNCGYLGLINNACPRCYTTIAFGAVPLSGRINGMGVGNARTPVNVGSYRYHFKFKDMDDGYQLIKLVAPNDRPSIITTEDRPNHYLVYNPNDQKNELTYHSWTYWKYVECECGYYGLNYYLFGNGKIFNTLPETID